MPPPPVSHGIETQARDEYTHVNLSFQKLALDSASVTTGILGTRALSLYPPPLAQVKACFLSYECAWRHVLCRGNAQP